MKQESGSAVEEDRSAPAQGFTLVELLLVVVIIGIVSGLAVPSFVRSYQGAKLRTSARSIVMASRYARSVAVLQQMETALLFDKKAQNIEVVAIKNDAAVDDRDMFLDARDQPAGNVDPEEHAQQVRDTYSVISKLRRAMAEDVKIISVSSESEEGLREVEGIYWINYYPNGMCDQYSVRIKDKFDKSISIAVDPMSGRASVEYD